MTISGALICGSMGDYTLYVGGDLSVDEFVVVDHNVKVLGKTTYNNYFARGGDSDWLAEVYLDEDDEPLWSEITDAVREGFRVFE